MNLANILVVPGKPALSTFALSKVQKHLPQICYAEYVHTLKLHAQLTGSEMERVNSLLDYGPDQNLPTSHGFRVVTVMPRSGTISPWSSKATDIFAICGLDKVERVERGVRWFVSEDAGVTALQINLDHLHDRMTQSYSEHEDFSNTFAQHAPKPLRNIGLLAQGRAALEQANISLGLALSDEEIEYLCVSYMQMQRDPTDVELMMFAQANSEHCRHKIFNAEWSVDGVVQSKSLFGMIRNTHKQINGRGVLSAYSDNAAVIEGSQDERLWVDGDSQAYRYHQEDIHILMKVETHNHPTAIAPFAGAATGSGGEIRDEGAVGRGSKPKAGLTGFTTSHLNIPGFTQPWEIPTGKPDHMASALDIMLQGPIGGASFNNEFGRPAISGYFRTFEMRINGQLRGYHKPIMIAGGVGSVRGEHVHSKDFPAGTALVVLGGPAMLIGLGGSAASSVASGSSASELDFASVQRGNPEMERRCQEVIDACCALGESNPIRLIHDVGAGGLSNALPELVHDANAGGSFRLRDVPNVDMGMSPLEIWCNEAQERYVMGVDSHCVEVFKQICERERCPYAVVGESTADGLLQVYDRQFDNHAVQMPLDVLLGKPPKMQRQFTRQPLSNAALDLSKIDLVQAINRVLHFPVVASKQFLITIGDRSITGLVACQPMIGPWQTPVADAAVTIRGYRSFAGEAFAIGERSPLALISPAASARMAVAESLTNLVCADIESIDRVVLSANWMAAAGTDIEDQSLFDAVTAVGEEFCPALGIAIPVGKDSLSMQTRWRTDGVEKNVVSPMSLIVTAFAPVTDVRLTLTPQLQPVQNSKLVLLDFGQLRMGASALAQVYQQLGDQAPDVESPQALRDLLDYLLQAKREHYLLAMHDRSDGGLITTLLEMAFAGRCGFDLYIDAGVGVLEYLFNEEIGVVVQIADEQVECFLSSVSCQAKVIGKVRSDELINLNHGDVTIFSSNRAELQKTWAATSFTLQRLRDNEQCADEEYAAIDKPSHLDPGLSASLTFEPSEDVAAPFINTGLQPKIAVLREQGVNGQMEMAAAFAAAGFECVDVHMSDLVTQRRQLSEFQAMVTCGGFSYGDVLGGGGGWAKSVLFNYQVRRQFEDFFNADTLVLGVCNGCQMLAHLHQLIPQAESWPRFVRNRSEQFEGRTVLTKVGVVDSPWLQGMQGSVMPVAVAHGEGRTEFRSASDIDTLAQRQQIALQYIDSRYDATEVYPANPNGADLGMAGVTANKGQVLIMMPHPERVYRSCQNVWQDPQWGDDGPWLRMFRNARVALG